MTELEARLRDIERKLAKTDVRTLTKMYVSWFPTGAELVSQDIPWLIEQIRDIRRRAPTTYTRG